MPVLFDRSAEQMIFFDGHVHIYDCFDLDIFFHSAFENFSKAREEAGVAAAGIDFLLLTESTGCNFFAKLKTMADSGGEEHGRLWSVQRTEERLSLLIVHQKYPEPLVITAGRQLVTREGLELSVLLTVAQFPQVMDLAAALTVVTSVGAVPVCPWGAGKWLGRRGRILADYVRSGGRNDFFLGDSGVRPSIWWCPPLLIAAKAEQRMLAGSDPLPLSGEERRVASFGGYCSGECSLKTPGASLYQLIVDPGTKIFGYGRLQCPLTFVYKQLLLRFN